MFQFSPISSFDVSNESSLVYSSYFGGSDNDHGLCVVQDSKGNIVIAGITESSDFPTTAGAYDQTFNGESDVFISKWTNDGKSLLFSTFLGGTADDTYIGSTGDPFHSLDIAIDSADNIIIYGTTSSTNFPTTIGALNETFNGNSDVFVTKLAKDGSSLIFSTYLGGSEKDFFNLGNQRLVLDETDTIYITGQSESSNFPLTPNALNDTIQDREAFLSKISADGSSVLYSTFLGGSDKEFGMTLALDSTNNMIISGLTYSNDYPVTSTAYDTTYSNDDLFISKISSDGSSLIFSTFLGGSGWEQVNGLVVDDNDDLLFTGTTTSTGFPTTSTSLGSTHNGSFDIFVSRLSADGTTIMACTLFGGTSKDFPSCLISSATGSPYILGYTLSTVSTTPNAFDSDLDGSSDYLLLKLDSSLSNLIYSSYLGGSSTDDHGVYYDGDGHDAGELVLLNTNSSLIVGSTRSVDFPITTDAYSNASSGSSDVFITNLMEKPVIIPSPATTSTYFIVPIIAMLLFIPLIRRKN
jgi:hypothetical protein